MALHTWLLCRTLKMVESFGIDVENSVSVKNSTGLKSYVD